MTREDWAECVGWLGARYGDKQWTEKIIEVYYDDLKRFDPTDVWTAIHMYHEKGNTRTPLPGQLINLTLESRRTRALEDQGQAALPAPRDTVSWAEYSTGAYGEILTFTEAIEREHLKSPCKIEGCRICEPDQATLDMATLADASPW